ncbi:MULTISPECIES: hypothetical protein [unclassified Mesorhizobium]|uniref:hypothetical protein n=1 Tax=unclassified Mesorhizobium TaxID=325217 RepID=UPI001CCBBAF4|nr:MULTISPECIES: hypothetical protein [unclassified Mesorhizobium]MBZ9738250.1 hypothetical protein [Mesorhizobium sp. CO1-1-4]MBZ9800949.1 hypothetical protein [Mesorhizobium sp. ES1-6]
MRHREDSRFLAWSSGNRFHQGGQSAEPGTAFTCFPGRGTGIGLLALLSWVLMPRAGR